MKCLFLLMVAAVFTAQGADWEFFSAPLSPDPAVGTTEGEAHVIRLPSRRSCGWWETTAAVEPGRGVRFTGRATIKLGKGESSAYNDVMMYVTWYDPEKGNRKGVSFYQRDFISYKDTLGADGVIVRTFDRTMPVPQKCNMIRIDLICKWHEMDVRFETIAAVSCDRPKPRVVRCVSGNPYEKGASFRAPGFEKTKPGWDDPDAVIASRLWQIEACLTNIFAHVERPDIILFSECFVNTGGSPCPEKTDELVPGGPSFALASKYAKKHRTYIAMNVREKTQEGTHHNTTFIVDRAGQLVGRYRKVTLTSGEYMAGLLPDDDFKVFDLDFGRVSCLTCWDNWFSESAKFLRRKEVELILFPLAGCANDHVEISFPARAIDTGIPFLVSMRQRHLPNGVIDAKGNWVAQTFEDGGFAWADIDLDAQPQTFWLSVGPGLGDARSLYVDESRPELYEKQNYGLHR